MLFIVIEVFDGYCFSVNLYYTSSNYKFSRCGPKYLKSIGCTCLIENKFLSRFFWPIRNSGIFCGIANQTTLSAGKGWVETEMVEKGLTKRN